MRIGAVFSRQQSRFGTDGDAHHVAVGHRKALVRKICVYLAHDLFPHCRRGVRQIRHDARGRIVAYPDRSSIIRRKADEIAVTVAVGRTGLTGDGHTGERRGGTRAAGGVDDALQKLDHRIGGALLHGDVGLGLILQNGVAVVVSHFNVGTRLGIDTVVGKCRIARRHLKRRHAVAQAAERQRARRGDIVAGERGEAQLLSHERIGLRRCEPLQHAHRRWVCGKAHRILQRDDALVAGVGVDRPDFVAHRIHGIVVDDGCRRNDTRFDRGCVDGQRLDRRAAGTRIGRIVQKERALTLADASGNGHHIARGIVDDRHAGLDWLTLGGGIVQIAAITVHTLNRLLHRGVDRAVDLIAAGIEHILGDLHAVTVLLHQIIDNVVERLLDKVGIVHRSSGGSFRFAAVRRHIVLIPDENELLIQRRFVVRITQVALLVHLVEHVALTFLVLLAVPVTARWIVFIRVLRDADDACRLSGCQLAHILAEIVLSCRLNAVSPLAEVNHIEVQFQHFLAGIILRKAQCAEDLRHLALDRDLVVAGQVFNDLLGDRGAAARRVAAAQHIENGASRTLPVHTLVLEETLVLDGNERLPDVIGNIFKVHQRAILCAVDLRQLCPLARCPILIVDRRTEVERIRRSVHIQ